MDASQNNNEIESSAQKCDSSLTENQISTSLKGFFKPLIENIDQSVTALRKSQVDLGVQIDSILDQMKVINEFQQKNLDLDEYTKKLGQIKKRVQCIHAVILAVEERTSKVYNAIKKDSMQ